LLSVSSDRLFKAMLQTKQVRVNIEVVSPGRICPEPIAIDPISTVKLKTTVPLDSQKIPEKLRTVIADLERLDIGRLDILSAMANITEQWGDDQVASVLVARASLLKRYRKVIRNL